METAANNKNDIQRSKFKTIDLVYIAVGTALIAICSWISIPTTVPFTLQTFAVFCVLGFLGGKRGTISVLIYILLGVIGVPVFAGFKAGVGVIIGTTGGYIVGFILMGLLYWLAEVLFKKYMRSIRMTAANVAVRAAVMIVGLLVCYAFGTAWFIVAYARSAEAVGLITALGWCVIPFIVPDLVKMAAAIVIASRLKRYLK